MGGVLLIKKKGVLLIKRRQTHFFVQNFIHMERTQKNDDVNDVNDVNDYEEENTALTARNE